MFFKDEYYFLSNMKDLKQEIVYNDLKGNNVEALYQASKLLKDEHRQIVCAMSGYEAKKASRRYPVDSDAISNKDKIMKDLLDIKFDIPLMSNLLLSTLSEVIVEDNEWHDYYWGRHGGVGANKLGIMLEDKRAELDKIAEVKRKMYIGNLYNKDIITMYDYVGFTANNCLNTKGELVMGKGNALLVKKLYPSLPKLLANQVTKDYNLIFQDNIFALQTKYHYRDGGDYDLIKAGIDKLITIANDNNDKLYALPVPGIGNGGLELSKVLMLMTELPSNVHVWKYPEHFKYTGVGSRRVTEEIMSLATNKALELSEWFVSRSGDADGIDTAIRNGSGDKIEAYIPWENFNKSKSKLFKQIVITKVFAKLNHVAWEYLTPPVKKLMSRNVLQVMGEDVNELSDFEMCYTPDGCNHWNTRDNKKNGTGGTGLAISLASKLGVPVYNIANKEDLARIELIIKSLK